jgi:mRNA interferase RelE/StbE
MRYRVILPQVGSEATGSAIREVASRIQTRLRALESNPRPPDVKKLKGRPAWRVRVGDYRVIYEIHDRELLVIIVTLGHRGDVYR